MTTAKQNGRSAGSKSAAPAPYGPIQSILLNTRHPPAGLVLQRLLLKARAARARMRERTAMGRFALR